MWMTTQEVCEQFKVSRTTLYRLRMAGVLHPIRIGVQLRWNINELTTTN